MISKFQFGGGVSLNANVLLKEPKKSILGVNAWLNNNNIQTNTGMNYNFGDSTFTAKAGVGGGNGRFNGSVQGEVSTNIKNKQTTGAVNGSLTYNNNGNMVSGNVAFNNLGTDKASMNAGFNYNHFDQTNMPVSDNPYANRPTQEPGESNEAYEERLQKYFASQGIDIQQNRFGGKFNYFNYGK